MEYGKVWIMKRKLTTEYNSDIYISTTLKLLYLRTFSILMNALPKRSLVYESKENHVTYNS